jgi:hypothetical protein
MDEKQTVIGNSEEIRTEVIAHYFVVAKMKNSNLGWFAISDCGVDHRDRESVVRNAEASWSVSYDLMVIETLLPVRL